jgi:hypothetical protein
MRSDSLVRTIEVTDRNGDPVGTKDVVTYPGLLSKAHEESLTRIKTQLLQIPEKANGQTAIAKAEVETSRGTFEALGDASPENVEDFLVPHLIRVAETRAKARALRDAVNIGVVSVEELDGVGLLPEVPDPGSGAPRGNGSTRRPAPRPVQGRPNGPRPAQSAPAPMSEAQRRYLFRLLAAQGVTGENAHQALKETFGVDSLSKVTKADATREIDQLLREAEGADHANAQR